MLADLHGVFLAELLLATLIVLHLIGQLALMLSADQFGPSVLDQGQLPELQLLSGLVMSQQHGALQVLLRLTLVQVLQVRMKKEVKG